jgi:hypothetical protein
VKRIIENALLAICVIGAPTSVYALPFREDPQSFQNYLNQVITWDDGSKMYYQNLHKCSSYYNPGYYCTAGFVKVSNPMGVKICSIELVSFKDSRISNRWGTCRYQ